eukprot:gene10907-12904_t
MEFNGLPERWTDLIMNSQSLVAVAIMQLDFLDWVNKRGGDESTSLFEGRALESALFRYEHEWLPLAAKNLEKLSAGILCPPADVAWVWHCHLLCPQSYVPDCLSTIGMLLDSNAHLLYELPLLTTHPSHLASARLWEQEYGTSFAPPVNDVHADISQSSKIVYDIAASAGRQRSFNYQVGRPYFRDPSFLQQGFLRYQRTLELKGSNPKAFLVPTYDTDLIWHCHQVHPVAYARHTNQACGQLLKHDDSVNDRAPGSRLVDAHKVTQQLWYDTYGEQFDNPTAMFRGDPPPFASMEGDVNRLDWTAEGPRQITFIAAGLQLQSSESDVAGTISNFRWNLEATYYTPLGAAIDKGMHVSSSDSKSVTWVADATARLGVSSNLFWVHSPQVIATSTARLVVKLHEKLSLFPRLLRLLRCRRSPVYTVELSLEEIRDRFNGMMRNAQQTPVPLKSNLRRLDSIALKDASERSMPPIVRPLQPVEGVSSSPSNPGFLRFDWHALDHPAVRVLQMSLAAHALGVPSPSVPRVENGVMMPAYPRSITAATYDANMQQEPQCLHGATTDFTSNVAVVWNNPFPQECQHAAGAADTGRCRQVAASCVLHHCGPSSPAPRALGVVMEDARREIARVKELSEKAFPTSLSADTPYTGPFFKYSYIQGETYKYFLLSVRGHDWGVVRAKWTGHRPAVSPVAPIPPDKERGIKGIPGKKGKPCVPGQLELEFFDWTVDRSEGEWKLGLHSWQQFGPGPVSLNFMPYLGRSGEAHCMVLRDPSGLERMAVDMMSGQVFLPEGEDYAKGLALGCTLALAHLLTCPATVIKNGLETGIYTLSGVVVVPVLAVGAVLAVLAVVVVAVVAVVVVVVAEVVTDLMSPLRETCDLQ